MEDGSVSRAVGRCNEGCSVSLGRLVSLGSTLEVVEARRDEGDWDTRDTRVTRDPRQLHELE